MFHNPAHFLVSTLAIFLPFLHSHKNEKWLHLLQVFYDHKVKVTRDSTHLGLYIEILLTTQCSTEQKKPLLLSIFLCPKIFL